MRVSGERINLKDYYVSLYVVQMCPHVRPALNQVMTALDCVSDNMHWHTRLYTYFHNLESFIQVSSEGRMSV